MPDVFIELPHAKHAFNFLPSIRALALNDAVLAFVKAIQVRRAASAAGTRRLTLPRASPQDIRGSNAGASSPRAKL